MTLIWMVALAAASAVYGVLTEPNNVIHGTISIGGNSMTATNTNIVVEARGTSNGLAIATYRMGSDPNHHPFFYSFEVNMEAYVPVGNSNALQTVITNQIYLVLINNGVVVSTKTYSTSRRGVLARVDFGPLIDADNDGLYDFEEFDWKTQSGNPDTDDDGLLDGEEVHTYGTIPTDWDTDDDGDSDGAEVQFGTDPLDPASFLASICGDVLYSGLETGSVHVSISLWPNNQVLVLGNTGDYVAVTGLVYDTVGQLTGLTVEAWINTTGTAQHIVVGWDRSRAWRLTVGDDRLGGYSGYVGFDTTDQASDRHDMRGTNLVNDGQWHHIAATYDSTTGTKRIYVDGTLDTEAMAAHNPGRRLVNISNERYGFLGVGSEATTFDGTKLPQHWFVGSMDEVRIWHRELKQTEIDVNMHGPLAGEHPGLEACWGFDDGTGADTTGHGNHGYLRGNAAIVYGGAHAQKGEAVLLGPGSYCVTNLPTLTNYWISAFMDSSGNDQWDIGEPYGAYFFNPIYLVGDTFGIDILLTDDGIPLDSDSDGLPNFWEDRYGLNAYSSVGDDGADGDPDDDGFPNKGEFGADTNPQSDESMLCIKNIHFNGTAFIVDWQGGTSSWQRIQHGPGKDDEGFWDTIHADFPPTPETNTLTFPLGTNFMGWFRLEAGR